MCTTQTDAHTTRAHESTHRRCNKNRYGLVEFGLSRAGQYRSEQGRCRPGRCRPGQGRAKQCRAEHSSFILLLRFLPEAIAVSLNELRCGVRRPHIRSDGRASAVILRLDLKRVLREQLSILNLPDGSYPEPVLANGCFCKTNKTEKENERRFRTCAPCWFLRD